MNREQMDVDAMTYEERLPPVRRWVHAFLENWIFAFIVAMVIRQFFLEPFMIPSASMEPMMLGSKIMSKADHVVVNKLSLRFTDSERWDVTVFEFPIPEFQDVNGREHQVFEETAQQEQSHWLLRPLSHRNFVKRLVVLPGDEFFIAGGDVYVKGANGAEGFDIPQKSRTLQDALWQTMYQHGVVDGYVPWSEGARVVDEHLSIAVAGERSVQFTQPLSNLYMKEWTYNVVPVARPFAQPAQVTLSMVKPLFHYEGQQGNAWDLDRWSINRLSTRDLDREYGANLNQSMDENIGDMRVVFTCEEIQGQPSLNIIDRDGVTYRLRLQGAAQWSLERINKQGQAVSIAAGTDALVGVPLALCHLDNRVWFEVNGVPVHDAVTVSRCTDMDGQCRIQWSGQGSVVLSACRVERDVHYCRSGFLKDLKRARVAARKHAAWIQKKGRLAQNGAQLQRHISAWGSKGEQGFRTHVKRVLTNATRVYARYDDDSMGVHRLIRERLLGRACVGHEAFEPIGDSPEHALIAPANAYLLLGDNSPFSWDSRGWGWVPGTNIRGRGAWVIFPFSRMKSIR